MALSSPSLNTRVPEPIAASVGNSIRGGVATRILNDFFFPHPQTQHKNVARPLVPHCERARHEGRRALDVAAILLLERN